MHSFVCRLLVLGLGGALLASCQQEKTDVAIVAPAEPIDQFTDRVKNCAPAKPMEIVLRGPGPKPARYEICQGPETRVEVAIDKNKRVYVLLQQRGFTFDSPEEYGVTVLRPDQDAMQELGHFVIPIGSTVDPARVHDFWKAEVAESGEGIRIEFRASNGMRDHVVHVNPSSKAFAISQAPNSDAERAKAIVVDDDSVHADSSFDKTYAIRVAREGLPDLTRAIGAGKFRAQASRETDAAGQIFALLTWTRGGTQPLDELTVFHVKDDRIAKLAEFHLAWALDGASYYSISHRVVLARTAGLSIDMTGALGGGRPTEEFGPPSVPSNPRWVVWFDAKP